jgi:hypothetical protein
MENNNADSFPFHLFQAEDSYSTEYQKIAAKSKARRRPDVGIAEALLLLSLNTNPNANANVNRMRSFVC